MERTSVSDTLTIGSSIPQFLLPATDGQSYGSNYLADAKAALVIFTCNHCPYVKGSEQQLNQTIQGFMERGLKVLAINSNDALQYPDDSFEKMKEKAWPYPYLYDADQSIAKAFDAACTPECYLFDANSKLAFHGTINDNPRNPDLAKNNFLQTAIEQVLTGADVHPNFAHPIGCSIKWKN